MKLNIEKALKKNGFVIYPILGSSMYPLLKEKIDRVYLENANELKVYDIVLYKRKKHKYVLHRIIDINEDILTIIGDNSCHIEHINTKDVLAKLTGIYKDSKLIKINDNKFKELDNRCIYRDQSLKTQLLIDHKAFFLKRKKEAYYELLKLAVTGSYDKEKLTTLTQNELINLCNYLEEKKAIHLLGFAIDKYKLNIDEKISSFIVKKYQSILARVTKINYIINQISNALNSNKIKHIFLKGAETKNLYKFPFLRNSNDIDIYIDKDNYEIAKGILINKLKCIPLKHSPHDESFLFNNIKIELHHTISSHLPSDLIYLLDKPFKDAKIDKTNKYRFHLSDTYTILHFLSHSMKHMRQGAFWWTMIVDFYYYLNNKEINDGIIKIARTYKYYLTLKNYINHIFSSEPLTNDGVIFEKLLFIDSSKISMVINSRKSNKIKYLFSRFFLSYSELKTKYKILEKHPILFPLLSIYRWLTLPFTISKTGKQEIEAIKNRNDSLIDDLKQIGLQEYLVNQESE